MKNTILTFSLMIMVGVLGFTAGWNAQTATEPHLINLAETEPHVVLAKSGIRQNEARQQNEGCPVLPNGDLSQQKGKEQETQLMKGLVF